MYTSILNHNQFKPDPICVRSRFPTTVVNNRRHLFWGEGAHLFLPDLVDTGVTDMMCFYQDWYHTHKQSVMPGFHPYVPGALPTSWYRIFEHSGKARQMWSIWFIYYMHIHQLYTVYSNLRVYAGDKQSSLVVNRFEAGLHYSHKKSADVGQLLSVWKDEYGTFPSNPARLHWDGSYVLNGSRY